MSRLGTSFEGQGHIVNKFDVIGKRLPVATHILNKSTVTRITKVTVEVKTVERQTNVRTDEETKNYVSDNR